jgi:hypothetical protein
LTLESQVDVIGQQSYLISMNALALMTRVLGMKADGSTTGDGGTLLCGITF